MQIYFSMPENEKEFFSRLMFVLPLFATVELVLNVV